MTVLLAALLGCQQGVDPPIGGGTDGADDGGDDGDACASVIVSDDECDDRVVEAHGAAHIPACFGGIAFPPTPNEDFAFDEPGLVTGSPAEIGIWTPAVIDNESHLPIHAIHRPTGKMLVFGAHETGGSLTDKAVWVLPDPLRRARYQRKQLRRRLRHRPSNA